MQIIKMGFVLMVVTVLAAAALSSVNQRTKPIIDSIKAEKKANALNSVMPKAGEGVIVPVVREGKKNYYRAYAERDTTGLVGYACEAEGAGYSSTIKSIIGLEPDGTIGQVTILEQNETPGLGTKITAEGLYGGKKIPWYAQFAGKKVARLAVDKDGGAVEAVTGATISSRAAVNSIRHSILELETELGGFTKTVPDSGSAKDTDEEEAEK